MPTYKVSMADGNMSLVRTGTPEDAERFAREEWGRAQGPYKANLASPEDVDYAVALGCIIHDFGLSKAEPAPRATVPVPPPVKDEEPFTFTLLKQAWKRVAAAKQLGPAQEASYHLSRSNRDAFVSKHWADMPRYPKGTAPEYLTPDGDPVECVVSELAFKHVENAADLGVYGLRW